MKVKRIASEIEATLQAYGQAATDAAADGDHHRAALARAVHVEVERFSLGSIDLPELHERLTALAPDDPEIAKLLGLLHESAVSDERAKREIVSMGTK